MAKEEKYLKGVIAESDSSGVLVRTSGEGCTKAEQAAIICSLIVDFAENEIELSALIATAKAYYRAQKERECNE